MLWLFLSDYDQVIDFIFVGFRTEYNHSIAVGNETKESAMFRNFTFYFIKST